MLGFQGFYELLGVGEGPFADPPCRNRFVNRVEGRPNPSIAIAPRQLLQQRQMFLFFVNEGPQFIQLTFRQGQIPKEIIQHSLAVMTDARQPVTDRILVAFHQAGGRSNRDPFRQVAHARPINFFRRPNPRVGRAHPTGKEMTARSTLQTACPTMPPRPPEPRAVPRPPIPPTTPIPTIARGQLRDRNSLMRYSSGNCNWTCDTNTRFALPTSYRDTTNIYTGELIKSFSISGNHVAPISGLAFSPDGSQLAISSLDGTILIWNIP